MQQNLGPIGQVLDAKLRAALWPALLEVIDESNQHHGHTGAHPSGESHFRVRIAADQLVGKSRVAQHRMINEVLSFELKTRVHALTIEII